MRAWVGERTADELARAVRLLEACGDPVGEGIGADLRRFLEDDDE